MKEVVRGGSIDSNRRRRRNNIDINSNSSSNRSEVLLLLLVPPSSLLTPSFSFQVIMDGTLTWMPYCLQTFAMVRNIHRYYYTMGPGYR